MNPQHERLNERLEQSPRFTASDTREASKLPGGQDSEVDALVDLARRFQEAPQLRVDADFADALPLRPVGMNGAKMQSEDSEFGSGGGDFQEGMSCAGGAVPFVVRNLQPTHKSKRVPQPRRPGFHPGLGSQSFDYLRARGFLQNDDVGLRFANHRRQ